ncbi:HK97 family phage prohead protease [Cystobacter fuscus]
MAKKVIHKQLGELIPSEDGKIVFRCSDASKDRHGDRVFVNGVDLTNYTLNPVLLWNHNQDLPCVGTAKVWVEGSALYMSPTFSSANPLGTQLEAQVEAREIRAVSIGFIVLDAKPNEFDGWDYLRIELTEISFTNVPAHQGALREKSMTNELTALQKAHKRMAKRMKSQDEALTKMSAALEEAVKLLKELGQDEAEEPREGTNAETPAPESAEQKALKTKTKADDGSSPTATAGDPTCPSCGAACSVCMAAKAKTKAEALEDQPAPPPRKS